MKRRQLIRLMRAGALAAAGTGITAGFQTYQAQNSPLSVEYLGHTCFLFSGSGERILVNPFRTLGCTAGYRLPRVSSDLVLISSQLLDEGAVEVLPGNPRLLYEAGAYQLESLRIQGISTPHDRLNGRRFGTNVVWRWIQSGINILHLGGAASPITIEQRILMGRPDLLLLPVGGGPKSYNPQEALQAIQTLNPKIVVPTQYRTKAADEKACDIVPLEEFLSAASGIPVERVGSTLTLTPGNLPEKGPVIRVMNYSF